LYGNIRNRLPRKRSFVKSKLSAQDIEIADQALAAVDQSLLRGDLAIGLNAELKGGKQRVRN
jgi:hypothetical protein